MNKQTNIAPA